MGHPKLTLCDFQAHTGHDGWESFSPFVLKVARALRLAGLPYEHRHVAISEVRKLSRTGQLPVLLVGEELVPDSTAILRRIIQLAPGRIEETPEAWLWEEIADSTLYPFVLTTRWADDRGWPIPRDAFFRAVPAPLRGIVAPMVRRGVIRRLRASDFIRAGIASAYERLNGVLDGLEARCPDEGFWLGARPSVADVSLFAQLHSLRLPLTPWQAEEIRKRSRLSAWLDRVDSKTVRGETR